MWRHRFIYRNERIHAFEKQKIKENARYTSGESSSQARSVQREIFIGINRYTLHVPHHYVFNVRFQTIALRADEFNSVFSPAVVVVEAKMLFSIVCRAVLPLMFCMCAVLRALFPFSMAACEALSYCPYYHLALLLSFFIILSSSCWILFCFHFAGERIRTYTMDFFVALCHDVCAYFTIVFLEWIDFRLKVHLLSGTESVRHDNSTTRALWQRSEEKKKNKSSQSGKLCKKCGAHQTQCKSEHNRFSELNLSAQAKDHRRLESQRWPLHMYTYCTTFNYADYTNNYSARNFDGIKIVHTFI